MPDLGFEVKASMAEAQKWVNSLVGSLEVLSQKLTKVSASAKSGLPSSITKDRNVALWAKSSSMSINEMTTALANFQSAVQSAAATGNLDVGGAQQWATTLSASLNEIMSKLVGVSTLSKEGLPASPTQNQNLDTWAQASAVSVANLRAQLDNLKIATVEADTATAALTSEVRGTASAEAEAEAARSELIADLRDLERHAREAGDSMVAMSAKKMRVSIEQEELGNLDRRLDELRTEAQVQGVRIKIEPDEMAVNQAREMLKGIQRDYARLGEVGKSRMTKKMLAELQGISSTEMKKKIRETATALRSIGQAADARKLDKFAASMKKTKDYTEKTKKTMTLLGNTMKYVLTGILMKFFYQISKFFAGTVKNAMNLVETFNLFRVALGESVQPATEFVENMAKVFGLNPTELYKSVGVFYQIATGMNLAAKDAYTLSENLTKLSYDLASYYNATDANTAFVKLKAGIVGETEPLREWGIITTENALKAQLLKMGIDRTVESLSEVDKVLLRYITIMEATKNAQGDWARTIASPANQIRLYRTNMEQLSTTMGQVFLPLLNRVIPYVIAFAQVMRDLIRMTAIFFGINMEIQEFDASGAGEASAFMSDLAENAEDASSAAKELQKTLLGIDEINKMASPSEAAGGADTSKYGDSIFAGIEGYDNLMNTVKKRSDEIYNSMSESFRAFLNSDVWAGIKKVVGGVIDILKVLFDFVADNFDWIAPLAVGTFAFFEVSKAIEAIGFVVANWKLGVIMAVATGIYFLIDALTSPHGDMDATAKALERQREAITPWQDAYRKAAGVIGDVNLVVGNTGETIKEVSADIAETEAKISEIYATALKTNGEMRLEDIRQIEKYQADLAELNRKKVQLHVLNARATADMISAIMKYNKNLTEDELADLQKQLDNANAAIKTASAEAMRSEIAALQTKYAEVDRINNPQYEKEIAEIYSRYATQTAIIKKEYGNAVTNLLEYNQDTARLTADGYRNMVQANLDRETAAETYAAEIDRIQKDGNLSWEQRESELDKARATWFAAEKAWNDAYKQNAIQRNMDADQAYLAQIAQKVSQGLALSEQEKINVQTILDAWKPVEGQMKKDSEANFYAILTGVQAALPNVKTGAKSAADDVANAVKSAFGIGGSILDNPMYATGRAMMDGLSAGISSRVSGLTYQMATVADVLSGAFRDRNQVASPSKLYAETGKFIMDGLALGIEGGYAEVQKAMVNVPMDVTSKFSASPSLDASAFAKAQLSNADIGASIGKMISEALFANAQNNKGTSGDLIVPVQIDGREVARAVIPEFNRMAVRSGRTPF